MMTTLMTKYTSLTQPLSVRSWCTLSSSSFLLYHSCQVLSLGTSGKVRRETRSTDSRLTKTIKTTMNRSIVKRAWISPTTLDLTCSLYHTMMTVMRKLRWKSKMMIRQTRAFTSLRMTICLTVATLEIISMSLEFEHQRKRLIWHHCAKV